MTAKEVASLSVQPSVPLAERPTIALPTKQKVSAHDVMANKWEVIYLLRVVDVIVCHGLSLASTLATYGKPARCICWHIYSVPEARNLASVPGIVESQMQIVSAI